MPKEFFLSFKFLPFALALWAVAIAVYFLNHKQWKFSHYGFSVKKYFLLVSVLLIYPLWWTFHNNSPKLLVLFFIFAVCGMLAEALMSNCWKIFYKQPFYVYAVDTLDHKFTSLLNIIPWGVAGFMFISLVYYLAPVFTATQPQSAIINSGPVSVALPFYLVFITSILISLSLNAIIWCALLHFKHHSYQFKKVTLINYLFVSLPFWAPIAICAIIYGPVMLKLALAFGVLIALAEYIFGKICQFFVSKKLWAYNYAAHDDGHFTPLAILPFAFLGFYFWAIGLIFQTYYK